MTTITTKNGNTITIQDEKATVFSPELNADALQLIWNGSKWEIGFEARSRYEVVELVEALCIAKLELFIHLKTLNLPALKVW